MKVFKISGKFQQYDRWSDLEADFIGYFAKEDGSDVFTGYMEEQYGSPSSPIRYIKGLYIIIPQYNWGIFISAYKALILAGAEAP